MPGQERHDSSSLPLAIKEKDVEYQVFHLCTHTHCVMTVCSSRTDPNPSGFRGIEALLLYASCVL